MRTTLQQCSLLFKRTFTLPGLWPVRHHRQSQNHRVVGVGRDLCGSSGPTPLPKQGHLQQAAQDLVHAGFEYLQRRRVHSLPGQPVPVSGRQSHLGQQSIHTRQPALPTSLLLPSVFTEKLSSPHQRRAEAAPPAFVLYPALRLPPHGAAAEGEAVACPSAALMHPQQGHGDDW